MSNLKSSGHEKKRFKSFRKKKSYFGKAKEKQA